MHTNLNDVERADLAVARAAAPIDATPAGHMFGLVGMLGDQPPLRALTIALIAAGAVRRDRRLALAGARMLVAHTLATLAKTQVKRRVDRSRPELLIGEGHYEAHRGDSDEHDMTSFPSGHTAGSIAVAAAAARVYPQAGPAAIGAAMLVSVAQIPRRAHFVSDVVAGAAIGLVAERLIATVWPPQPAR